MTPVEILHVIVNTEQTARSLFTRALELREGLPDFLKSERERIRAELYVAAEEDIAAFDAAEIERAYCDIAALDTQFDADEEAIRKKYLATKVIVIDTLYAFAVKPDA